MSWNSVPGIRFSVATALTVGGAILALREFKIWNASNFSLWSKKSDGLEKLGVVPGLHNYGNNCFLNVILQALSSCSYFRNYLNKVIEEYETFPVKHPGSVLPLAVAVSDLMEELNTLGDRKVVLSPREVMCAVQCYNSNFNLAVQQDAAEAFLHLLCSLREEVTVSYVPNNGSLIDVSAVPRRILDPRRLLEDHNEQKRWKELYLGPFDGILGNILTCRSCSFQIMMDFEFFHNLPLLPITGMGTSIFYGCSLENCLKKYIAAEEVEGYKCDNCWHIAALKYLSATNGNKTDIDKLKYCSGQETCNCRFLMGLEAVSVPVSRAFKQLNIGRCPQILCIQLLRATTNLFGEPIKLEGHISFPMILNLSPFSRSGVEMEYVGQQVYPFRCINRQIEPGALSRVSFPRQEEKHSDALNDKVSSDGYKNKLDKETHSFQSGPGSDPQPKQYNQAPVEVSESKPCVPAMYRLVSVVEHMGKTGGGHYTVYRRMKPQCGDEEPDCGNTTPNQWFLISDSDVFHVSEKDVLSAQASILFYERINES